MSEPIRRQPRHRRRARVTVELTERDETLLHALARFRIARTSDLLRYAFVGIRRDTAAVRLRRLFDTKHLAMLPPMRGADNVYRLGPAGIQLVAAQGGAIGRVPRGGLDHHLATVATWSTIAGLEKLELERCLPDWEIREQFGVGELHAIPDLFLLARIGKDRCAVAIEVDRGTESMAVFARKLEVYRSLWGRTPGLFGYQQFGVAVACYASSRRAQLLSVLKKAWVIPHVLWLGTDSPNTALIKLFGEMATPLDYSPCRKGTQELVDGGRHE